MANLAAVYRDNAARAEAEAEASTLGNVRERNLRAAEAWAQMAERQERTDRARAVREAASAASVAAAAEARNRELT